MEEAQAVTLPARAFSVIILLAQKQNPNGEMESETSEEGEAELLAPILAVLLVLTSLLSGDASVKRRLQTLELGSNQFNDLSYVLTCYMLK